MSVYINGATAYFAKSLQKQTALLLNQQIELPYFHAFDEPLLSLERLYDYFAEQIEQCIQQAGWQLNELKNIPILLGSTAYVISDCEARIANKQPLPEQHSIAVIADYLRERYQTQVFSFATSCTSSAQAIAYAYKMLNARMVEKALVIGFEMFNRLTFEHFQAMNLLGQTQPYLPFVKSDGIVLGEGIGCVALSRGKNAHSPNCEIIAVASLTDHHNLTNCNQAMLEQLLQQCLTNANLQPQHIRAIKVHAVGSNSDEMEQRVLSTMFPEASWILTKPYMGHTLGASGALETALLFHSMNNPLGYFPEYANLPIMQNCSLSAGYYLNYFLGFGGSNVAWILKIE